MAPGLGEGILWIQSPLKKLTLRYILPLQRSLGKCISHTYTHTYLYRYVRIIGFIPFPRVLVLCEMQSFSSRIWTRVAVSISYDDNHYTTGTSFYPIPPLGQDMTQGQFFKRSLTGLNLEFSFSSTSCLNKAEEPSLIYYLPMAGGRIIGFIPFQRVLVLCEMQSVSSRIWTRVAVSISYDDNHYTTDISKLMINI